MPLINSVFSVVSFAGSLRGCLPVPRTLFCEGRQVGGHRGVMVFMQKHIPKTTHIQYFSGELKFTAIACVIQEGSIIFIYNEPTQKLVEHYEFFI